MSGSNKSDTQQTQSNVQNPWGAQAPFLTQAFNTASNGLTRAQQASDTPPPGFVAQFTPDQLNVFQQMMKAGTNPATADSSAAAGSKLASAGADATAGGLYGLSKWQPTTTTDSILNAGSKFADNPYMSGMVDAATRDAQRAVYENGIPQTDRSAAATGNINSSKSDIQKGILQRGLMDTTADVSANLRGNAFQNGLNLAQQNGQANDSNALQALMARVSGGTGAANAGVNANSAAVAQQGGLFDIANQGAAGGQAANQASIDDALARYGFNTSAPFAGLNNFWNVVGSNNWGGTSNSTGTKNVSETPSIFSTAGSLIGAAGFGAGKNGFNFFGK
jgi:hypothetical protein